MRYIKLLTLVPAAIALIMPASAAARLRAPAPVAPANGASFQQLPAISWKAVRGAAEYEYEISADAHFNSILGSGPGKGNYKTHNLAAAMDQAVPDGTYSWRVRGVTAKGGAGAWSRPRRIVKRWSTAPQLLGGDGAQITWPTTPLVLKWSAVPSAVKYIVTIATDPALSNSLLGSPSQPQYTDGTSFVLPSTLANGAYYWAVTPVDSEGHRGVRSPVGTFSWTWPTSTSTSFTNLSTDLRVLDPFFSWAPIPGAARYDVEISQSPDFPAGSKWCCTTATVGTSLAPQHVLGNNSTYWWRVRGVDGSGNAGQWNYGGSFAQAFDATTPTIPHLTMRSTDGQELTSGYPVTTDTPLVTWDPVPGASHYEVRLGSWTGSFCDFSTGSWYQIDTATTAWTPLARMGLSKPFDSPNPQSDIQPPLPTGEYCVRVRALRDVTESGQPVASDWTYLNGGNGSGGGAGPAFIYSQQPAIAFDAAHFATYVQTGDYKLPANGSSTTRTPYFTWNWTRGARAYWVVIARDQQFTNVVNVGLTSVPAYAPRLQQDAAGNIPLADKTTSYYWAVIPAQNPDGSGFDPELALDHPQQFNKSSIPPTLLAPDDGSAVSTWPTFRWTGAEGARNYRLQVSQDPTFGNTIDDVITDSTAYTSSSTYPADTVLYWRVRANDWTGQGLNWSAVHTFSRRLPSSSPAPANPTAGDGEPVLSWTATPGAIAYDVHIDQGNGTSTDATVYSTAFAPVDHYGIGTVRWQVRPLFPTTTFGTVAGGFFAPQPYLRTLSPPTGARGVKSGPRLLISWNPDPAAKQYEVDVSTTDSFSVPIDFHRVDGTSWAPDIDLSLPANRGRLYWRVAPVDSWGTVGSFATGSFLNGKPVKKRHKNHRPAHKKHRPAHKKHH